MGFDIKENVMLIMRSKKGQMTNKIELTIQEKNQNDWRKGKLQVLVNIENVHH